MGEKGEKEFTESVKSLRKRTEKLEHEGDYWTQEEREKLTRMFDVELKGITEIAILLQRTEPAVAQQIEKLDLYQRKENPQRQRGFAKEPVCLCSNCRLDSALCPRCTACGTEEEDV